MKKFGLIGKSLGHSFSKSFFDHKFDSEGIDASYTNFELPSLLDFKELALRCDGLNVTIPYKQEVISYLDEVSNEATAIGAVNTVLNDNGRLIGYNTDAFGFHQSIKPFLTNKHERAMILGTGGASKAVSFVLQKIGVDIIYISRTPNSENQFGYDEVNENMIDACKLIVNCTPVGTFPNEHEFVSIPFKRLGSDHLVVDLIYNPEKTKFLELSEQCGATILNGESMLKQQALKSFEFWSQKN